MDETRGFTNADALLGTLEPAARARLLEIKQAYPAVSLEALPEPLRAEAARILLRAASGRSQDAPLPRPDFKPPASLPRPWPDTRLVTAPLGTNEQTGRTVTISQHERLQGLSIIGRPGTGKTTLLQNLILADARQDVGIVLVEPHGDLTRAVMGGLPKTRLRDVVYLEVEDFAAPFGLNLFTCPEPRTIKTLAAAASYIAHVFEALWNTNGGFDTPRLSQNIRAITRTLLEHPDFTIAEAPLLYANYAVRQHLVASLTNSEISRFWQEYDERTRRDRELYTESTKSRMQAFLDEPMIKHIVGQSKTTIDFREIMDTGKILLVKLSPQFEEASRLIGAVIIGQILLSAFSRSELAEDKRRPCHLYCDEFQRYATPDFATLISEARKFNIATTISHQFLEQLHPLNQAAVQTAGNLVCFRVNAQDGRVLARAFETTPTPVVIGSEPIRAPVTDAVTHLVRRGHTNVRVSAFVSEYLMTLETTLQKVRGHIGSFQWGCTLLHTHQVIEGRRLVNDILFQSMQTGRADGFIPPLALFILGGAADDGITQVFYDVIKRNVLFTGPLCVGFHQRANRFGEAAFLQDQKAVADLLAKHAQKKVWDDVFSSRMVYPGPAFIRMLQSLREVMAILAKEPILVDTGQYQPRMQNRQYADQENQNARDLVNLTNFTAKVKLVSGEYVVQTSPAPASLAETEIDERIAWIKQQMLAQGIARPYQDVMREIALRQEKLKEISYQTIPPPSRTNGQGRGRAAPKRPPSRTGQKPQ